MAKMDFKKNELTDQSSSLSIYLPVHAFFHWSSINFFTYLSVYLIVYLSIGYHCLVKHMQPVVISVD